MILLLGQETLIREMEIEGNLVKNRNQMGLFRAWLLVHVSLVYQSPITWRVH